MKQKRLLSLLVLLVAVVSGAWAQTETLLTTLTFGGSSTYSETKSGVVSVTAINVIEYNGTYGWLWVGEGSLSVTAKEGYTITKCVFRQNAKDPITDTGAPFEIHADYSGMITEDEDGSMNGVTSIEVYGYAPPTYTVSLKEGTEDADKWTISPKTGLKGGETVTATYNGSKKVKSVKAVKKAAGNTYLKWDADQKKLVATDIPAGATMVQNVEGNVPWSAGTYVVEGNVTINGKITLTGNVDLIIKDDAKLTVNQINGTSKNLSIYGQANKSGQLVVDCSNIDAIYSITKLEVHSCQVTATSSSGGCCGFYEISTFNVYGGSVDGENTGTSGNGIELASSGSMNIYGGDVTAVGKGTSYYGIYGGSSSTVTVYGGKLWAENADKKAIDFGNVTLTKDTGYTSGKIEYSSDKSTWSETKDTSAKYVRVGY